MSDLNQFALSQALGSKMRPIKSTRFGGFGLLETTAEAVRAKHAPDGRGDLPRFTYDHDRVVCQAFEDVRHGASPGSILWDRLLQQEFNRRCRELGLDAPNALLNRRLLNIRKNKKRYEKHGIRLSPTTKTEPHPSMLPQFGHVVEFALVRLRYRYGLSIDDVLLDPELSDQFEQIALQGAPQLSPQDLRLGALYLRKTRYIPRNEEVRLAQLDLSLLDRQSLAPERLSQIKTGDVPDCPGIIELREEGRSLYVARNEHVKMAIEQFQTGHAFDILVSGFWKPDLDAIMVDYAPGVKFGGVPIAKWELRLIYERDPVFNWPIHKHAA